MIREATLDDCREIAKKGERFFREAGWGDVAEYRVDDCERTLRHLVTSDDGILIVADVGGVVGMAGGMVSPLYFNFSHKTGQELFWWTAVNAPLRTGLQLLDAMEDAARAKGCHSWVMMSLDKMNPAIMARMYRKRGYRPSEHSFIKRL